jgi:hypothetical protein
VSGFGACGDGGERSAWWRSNEVRGRGSNGRWAEWAETYGPQVMVAVRGSRGLRRQRRHEHHFPFFPLALVFFLFVFLNAELIVAALFALAICAAIVALFAFAVSPSLAGKAGQALGAGTGRLRESWRSNAAPAAPAPGVSANASSIAAPQAGYRERLLDLLKERYVRGEITLGEFELRASEIVRDPSVRHLA